MSELAAANLFGVKGKTVVITGGGRGIGQMIAEGFVANGAHVIVSSRDAKVCEQTARELSKIGPGTCVAMPANLGNEEGCMALLKQIQGHTDKVHVLINNSGTGWGAPLEKTTMASWDKVMDLNVKFLFALTVGLLPLLDKAATAEDPSRIINIGSVAGMQPQPFPTFAYDVSKAAVHHLTKKLSTWLARRETPSLHSITVNAIAPGYVPTKMTEGLWGAYGKVEGTDVNPLPRVGVKGDMAAAALYLASKGGAWVTGIVLPVDGGMSAAPMSFSGNTKSKL